MTLRFEIFGRDALTSARAGRMETPHGVIETPVFMPVGTQGTVKGILPAQLHEIGARIILGNTYHLALRPGADRIKKLGGLHRFIGWSGSILTDSGGFQIFSLTSLRKLGDDGVEFRSHIDGKTLTLTPESATRLQEDLGADIIMCFDECPPANGSREMIATAVERTTRWARRCQQVHARKDQALFGIVQGGTVAELRARSASELIELDFPGYAIGGLSVGESSAEMYSTLNVVCPLLPENKPRYLMGVGTPANLLEAIARGVDMFDCVMPTRNGRNALAFTHGGKLRLRNACYAEDESPLDERCACPVCREFSRAYIRHLFLAEEMLGPILVSLHNLAYYQRLMSEAREAILAGTFDQYRREALAGWGDDS